MVFSKAFPRTVDGSNYPKWEEIFLSAQEEREREQVARQDNLYLVRQCLADARNVIKDEKLIENQSAVLGIALSLFKKRAIHSVYYKEEECQKKFLKYWGKFKKSSTSSDKKVEIKKISNKNKKN